MRKAIFGSLIGVLLSISSVSVNAEELLLDNSGYVKEEVYDDNTLESMYGDIDYYDCYIPYKKLIGEIGGYTVDVYGLESAKENDAVADIYRFMDEDARLKEVGSVVGYYDSIENLSDYYKGVDEVTGLNIFSDSNGNEYYGMSVAPFFFYEGSVEWGRNVIGQLIDVIFDDGTVLHFVVDDLMWESQCNGWSSESSIGDNGFHSEIMFFQYAGLFDDSEGYTLKVSGSGSENFYDVYGIGEDRNIAYYRVYDKKISDSDIYRDSRDVKSEYSGTVVYTDKREDEVTYSGEINSDELGKGKKKVASKFSEETQKIVEEHCLDFNVKNFEEFMESQGGYENYLKSLGGVFAQFAGDDVKIPVKTAGDYKVACEYVFGIICIWGFDYSNGDPGHYGRWRSGDGVTESNVTEEAFYPKGYSIPYVYKDKYAAPRRIDLIASQEGVTQEGVNTCCNFCVDLIRNKIELADYLTTSEGKQPGTCSIKTQRKLTEKLIGEPGIYKAVDLKVGDLIHCYNHGLSSYEKNNADASISGWFHVLVVGEVDKEAGTITLYETGHDLTNDGNYKNTVKISSGLPYTGWLGTRWFNIDESTETTLDGFSSGSSTSSLQYDDIPNEEDLVGMPDDFKISDGAEIISLADYDSLSVSEKRELQNIKSGLSENSKEEKILTYIRVLVAFVGLWLMLYIVLLNVAFLFDKSNNFIDISLLAIITLGVITRDDRDIAESGMSGYKRILKISVVMFIASIILLSGSMYLWVSKIVRLVSNLL